MQWQSKTSAVGSLSLRPWEMSRAQRAVVLMGDEECIKKGLLSKYLFEVPRADKRNVCFGYLLLYK